MRTVAKPGDGRRRVMEDRKSCPEQKKKELSTKEHEGRRRATKRDGSAASARLQPGKPARAPSRSKSVWKEGPPGARASRPHALPFGAAQFPWNGAPGHPPRENGMGPAVADSWRRCRSSPVEELGEALPVWCGRDARAPGGASSHNVVAPKEVHRSSCLFVFIRGSSSKTIGCFSLV